MPPQLLAGRRRKGQHDFFLPLPRVDEDAVTDDDGRRLADLTDADLPELMESRGKHSGKFTAGGDTVAIRSPPLRPVGALYGRAEQHRADDEDALAPIFLIG